MVIDIIKWNECCIGRISFKDVMFWKSFFSVQIQVLEVQMYEVRWQEENLWVVWMGND